MRDFFRQHPASSERENIIRRAPTTTTQICEAGSKEEGIVSWGERRGGNFSLFALRQRRICALLDPAGVAVVVVVVVVGEVV